VRTRCLVWPALALSLGGAACGGPIDLGSDLLWTATFEGQSLDEWSLPPAGGSNVNPATGSLTVEDVRAHRGRFAAQLTVNAPADGMQKNTELMRSGLLPEEAYYSAWYYLPRSVAVNGFWVIFKLRLRRAVDDPTTEDELYDLDLSGQPSGEMALFLYDHRAAVAVPLDVPAPAVPIDRWFQIEAFYRNAQDDTGRVTYWLDGQAIVDVRGKPMAPNAWVGWEAASIAKDLTPSDAVVYVDDCAISRSRVGPDGLLGP
jgi:hypothetical protein